MIQIVLLLFIIPDECNYSFLQVFLNWNYGIHIFIIYFYPTFHYMLKNTFPKFATVKTESWKESWKLHSIKTTSVILKAQQSQKAAVREGVGEGHCAWNAHVSDCKNNSCVDQREWRYFCISKKHSMWSVQEINSSWRPKLEEKNVLHIIIRI